MKYGNCYQSFTAVVYAILVQNILFVFHNAYAKVNTNNSVCK